MVAATRTVAGFLARRAGRLSLDDDFAADAVSADLLLAVDAADPWRDLSATPTPLIQLDRRGGPSRPVAESDDIAIAAITLAELRHGVLAGDAGRRRAREQFVQDVEEAIEVLERRRQNTRHCSTTSGAQGRLVAATTSSSLRTHGRPADRSSPATSGHGSAIHPVSALPSTRCRSGLDEVTPAQAAATQPT